MSLEFGFTRRATAGLIGQTINEQLSGIHCEAKW